jgi:hypothetical protein
MVTAAVLTVAATIAVVHAERSASPGPDTGSLAASVNVGTASECAAATAAHPRWTLALLQLDVAPHPSPIVVEQVDFAALRGLRVLEVDVLRGGGIGAVYFPPSFGRSDRSVALAWAGRQRVGPATLPAQSHTSTVSLVAAVELAPGFRAGSFGHAEIHYREGGNTYERDTVLGGQLKAGHC